MGFLGWTEGVAPTIQRGIEKSGGTPALEAGGYKVLFAMVYDQSCDQTRKYPPWDKPQVAEILGFGEQGEPVLVTQNNHPI